MPLLPRPKILSNGFAETPEYQAALAEYLTHCVSIGNIIAASHITFEAEIRVNRYLKMVDFQC